MDIDWRGPHALGRPAAPRVRRRLNWSAERIALLRRRWAEGASASTIARELGANVSRCAVLGKVHRLKLTQPAFKRLHPAKEAGFKRRRAAGKPRAPARSQLMAVFEALGLGAAFAAADLRTVEAHACTAFGPACSLLELTEATCRWPVGEPGETGFAFCGAAPLAGYPYCRAHCLIAYRPQRPERGASAPGKSSPARQYRSRRAA
jgi:GcrA cell cycle regulator